MRNPYEQHHLVTTVDEDSDIPKYDCREEPEALIHIQMHLDVNLAVFVRVNAKFVDIQTDPETPGSRQSADFITLIICSREQSVEHTSSFLGCDAG